MDVRVGLWRRLSAGELMFLNCGVGEDSWESLGLQGDPSSPFWRRWAWDFFGRNDAEAETPVLWPPHAKSWLIGKDSDAGRHWGPEENVTTEDEMSGWHHWLDGRESEWTPGVGDGQGGLECCDSWGRKESDTTERLIWSNYPDAKVKQRHHEIRKLQTNISYEHGHKNSQQNTNKQNPATDEHITKGPEETFEDGVCVHYLLCSGGFMSYTYVKL